MSSQLTLPPGSFRTAAPPGSQRPSRRSGSPPDAWVPLNPSLLQQARSRLDYVLLRAVGSSSRWISRRQFLRRLGQVGVLVGVSAGSVLWRQDRSLAHGRTCFMPCNACGPSPPCNQSLGYCNSNGQCNLGTAGVRRRTHDDFTCTCDSCDNSWTDHCCSCLGVHYQCNDCCTPTGGTDKCVGGCSDKHACICKKNKGPDGC